MHYYSSTLLPVALLALGASARTNQEGCVSTQVPFWTSEHIVYSSALWYVPDTGEICRGVDCGGGRAPAKTIPGCPAYKGTETVTPSFWKDWKPASTETTPTATDTATVSTTATTLATITAPAGYSGSLTAAAGAQETGGAAPAVESDSSSSSSSSSSVSTAGAAPTGVAVIGVVAGLAAGLVFAA